MGDNYKIKLNGVELTSDSEDSFYMDYEMFEDLNTGDLPLNITFQLENMDSIEEMLDYLEPMTIRNVGQKVEINITTELSFDAEGTDDLNTPNSDERVVDTNYCEFDYNICLAHSSLKEILIKTYKLNCDVNERVSGFFGCDLNIKVTDDAETEERSSE